MLFRSQHFNEILTNKQTLHIMPGGTSNAVGEDYMDDDLFDYDADIPDIDTTIRQPTPKKDGKKDNLGLDEEVKIKRKRVNVKLDEARYGGEREAGVLRSSANRFS